MPYLRFKIPEMTSAAATVATFATVSESSGRNVATVASVAGAGRNFDIQPVATAAAIASHPTARRPPTLKERWNRLKTAIGTASSDFVSQTLFRPQTAAMLPSGGTSEVAVNAALSMIEAAKPKDESRPP